MVPPTPLAPTPLQRFPHELRYHSEDPLCCWLGWFFRDSGFRVWGFRGLGVRDGLATMGNNIWHWQSSGSHGTVSGFSGALFFPLQLNLQ